MTAILGVSAFYHDSAAALVIDGQIVAAAAEERFSRRKHDSAFPTRAAKYCLAEAGLRPADLDYVGFYEKPLLKFDRLLESHLTFAPRGYRSFRQAMPSWMTTKLRIPRIIARELPGYHKRTVFCSHHESHAASAFYPSPFEEAAILTVDGVGEWATATIGTGRGNRIEIHSELRFPHSLGLLYSAFTAHCGFEVNECEYKLMGLAPYGNPIYRDTILEKLIDLKADGSFRLDMQYFHYCHGLTMTSPRFAQLFGVPPRLPGSEIRQQYKDLAASIQAVTEQVMLRMADHVHRTTGMKNLVLAGGVALNCVANGRIAREGSFENIWIQPAAGDDGGALGVAMLIWHQLLDRERTPTASDSLRGSLLGPSYNDAAICHLLDSHGEPYETASDDDQLCRQTAAMLAEGKVIGWFQGRMENGPRALGGRSILADPRDPRMQVRLNATVKNRESFRPFAPAVLEEKADNYFQFAADQAHPYMLITAPCLTASELPAVTHVDGSARLQIVDRKRFELFHRLLESFEELTGWGVLVNTSFNVRGEPIVCTPDDAYRCFRGTDLDALVIGRQIVRKPVGVAPPSPADGQTTRKRSRFTHLDIPWQPTASQLWRFVLTTSIMLPVVALLTKQSWAMITVAAMLSVIGLLVSLWTRWPAIVLYRAILVISLPILLLVSELLLAGIYFGVLTPVGLLLRLAGRQGLALQIDKATDSYWQESNSRRARIDYYRQS